METLNNQINSCTSCDLCKTRNKVVPGEGPLNAKIMFVGEAPGKVNDETGRPFVGYGGKIFDKILDKCGIKREKVFITNVIKCWPPENRKPKKSEIKCCEGYLFKQINLIKPKIIITLGTVAYQTVTGEAIKIRDQHGSLIKKEGIMVCPTFHPNGLRYLKGGMQTIVNDIKGCV